ncbi:MAG: DUF4143 domain-containing protein, partial [Leptospirales bacterium]
MAELARDADIGFNTAKSWLSVLQRSGIVYLLEPYHNNITKRLVKSPKLYFLDTGLCPYLTAWSSPETLEAGAMSGAILETWILSELLKGYWHNGRMASFYFYRDKDSKEIDLVISKDGRLYPIAFKKNLFSPKGGRPLLQCTGETVGSDRSGGADLSFRNIDPLVSRRPDDFCARSLSFLARSPSACPLVVESFEQPERVAGSRTGYSFRGQTTKEKRRKGGFVPDMCFIVSMTETPDGERPRREGSDHRPFSSSCRIRSTHWGFTSRMEAIS